MTHKLLTTLLLVLMTVPVNAENLCGKRDEFIKALAANAKESRVSLGLTTTGIIVELFLSPTKTWTLLQTFPNGQTCFVGAGIEWQNTPLISGQDT